MSNDIAISVQNLTKIYKLYDTPLDRLKESVNPFGKKYHKDFYALNDVSFEIKKGETVGIIGKNGSGKSTLLKIITGVLTPSSGNVTVNGKISALLELGAGFNPELTGIENVFFNGMLMGYSREEMNEKLDAILSFADIGEFVYQPVKTYSSGMFIRLAFAVAVNVEPEILIVDEALSVGDVFFQQKCFAKIRKILESQITFLFVSHDMSALQNLCDRGILLKQGIKILDGKPIECASAYYMPDNSVIKHQTEVPDQDTTYNDKVGKFINKVTVIDNNILCSSNKQQGDRGLEIVAVEFESQSGPGYDVEFGDYVLVKVLLRANLFIVIPNVGFSLFDRMNNLVFCTSAYQMNHKIGPMKPREEEIVAFKVSMNVQTGEYPFAVGCSAINPDDPSTSHVHHRWLELGPIRVVRNNDRRPPISGMVQLPCEINSLIRKNI